MNTLPGLRSQTTQFHCWNRPSKTDLLLLALVILTCTAAVPGATILEIDTDGADDGVLTYNANFSFGGDTTTASQSVTSTAFGTTGGDSLFGGDGTVLPDTYAYSYTPDLAPDNLVVPLNFDLGGGNLASGLVGGGLGTYRVYATWPYTENVSGGDTRYTISATGTADVIVDIDQNFKGGDEWISLGNIVYSAPGTSIFVTQEPTIANSFVSMRSHGLLFERICDRDQRPVPAPSSLSIVGIGLVGLGWVRQRRWA